MFTSTSSRPAVKRSAGLVFLSTQAGQQKSALWMSVFCGSIATAFMLAQWVAFSYVVEQTVLNDVALSSLRISCLVFVFSAVIRPVLVRLQTRYSQGASLAIRDKIRRRILQHWRTSSPLAIKHTSAGAFATQWIDDVESMDGYFSRYWPQQLLAIISPVLIVCTVAYFNWLCALLLLISAPLIPVFMVLVGMGAQRLNQRYSTIRQRLAGHFLDRVASLSGIKLLNAHHQVLEEVSQRSERYREVVMKTLKLAFLSSTVLEFFTTVGIASLAIYIGFSLYGAITWGPAQHLTLYSGLTILLLAPEFFQPLRNLSQYYHDRANALGAADNLALLLNNDGGSLRSVTNLGNSLINKQQMNKPWLLECRNLRVAAHKGEPLTKALNIKLARGQRLVITGSSGTGKSTFLNTLAGYLPAHSGKLFFAAHRPPPMAYLPQQAWIKNATIFENLLLWAPNASKPQMLEVLHQLGLAPELLNSHQGLETRIGEHGQGLSGGQMQRIALARVLLTPPDIVILDEPTAKLDVQSKQLILKALNTLQHQCLLIIATHDYALIQDADVMLNLNEHKESGNDVLV